MAPIAMTLSDLKGHACCLKTNFHTSGNIAHISNDVFTGKSNSTCGL